MSDSDIELERDYIVPLSRAWIAPRHRRTVRAINVLREFAERHMKSSEIKIDSELNEQLWNRGITRPPRRIAVRMTKDEDGLVTISLPKITESEEENEVETAIPSEESKASIPEETKKETPVSDKTETKQIPSKKPAQKKKTKKAKSKQNKK